MIDLTKINKAIICVEDGVLDITIGNVNEKNPHFHNKVSIEILDGKDLYIKGNKLISKTFYMDRMDERYENFDFYCEKLIGFKERVKTKKIFSWKQFKFVPLRYLNVSIHSLHTFCYKDDVWPSKEYKSNNYVISQV